MNTVLCTVPAVPRGVDLRRTRLFFFQQQLDTCLLWPFVSDSASTPRWHYFIRSKQRLPLNRCLAQSSLNSADFRGCLRTLQGKPPCQEAPAHSPPGDWLTPVLIRTVGSADKGQTQVEIIDTHTELWNANASAATCLFSKVGDQVAASVRRSCVWKVLPGCICHKDTPWGVFLADNLI